eukprot:NODE_487_length_1693_cov_88.116180_g404_i0.p1 GENE.NODE_487_length_1693_cov_88.116180_g404_i0~~NODE_487_length_1693_cov_88.116180_g404_i0.p1  ORF type:complete len:260 (+),score=57.61 NODE_487_length_1693_cov_88.116180_g404_i0:543-1322(+)
METISFLPPEGIATIATVGYGRISATTMAERLASMAIMIAGVGYYSYVIGNVASLVTQLQQAGRAQSYRMTMIRSFSVDSKLPKDLRVEVFNYFSERTIRNYDSRSLLADMPSNLRSQVLEHLYGPLIASLPLFKGCPRTFATEVCSRLRLVFFQKGSLVCMRGEIGKEMYILTAGELEIVELKGTDNAVKLRPGDCFGEGAVLGDCTRHNTIQAVTNSTLCIIKSDDMAEILSGFPEVRFKMTTQYKERYRWGTLALQ